MGLETFSYITSLNASNPVHATDPVSQGDDHLRGLKTTLLNSFPNVNAAVNFTPTQANYLVGVTSAIQTQIDGKAATSHNHAASDVTSGTFANARISVGSVTQWEASLTITESQISDLGSYLSDGDQITTLEVGHASDTTLARAASGVLQVENQAILSHESTSYNSAKINISTSNPSGGTNGDFWFKREA